MLKICSCSVPSTSKVIIAGLFFDLYGQRPRDCLLLVGSDLRYPYQDIWNLSQKYGNFTQKRPQMSYESHYHTLK